MRIEKIYIDIGSIKIEIFDLKKSEFKNFEFN